MSMMRREAAIKSCEDRIRHLESVPPHYYGKRQRGRAIELEKVKIKALRPVSREQVERVWPGCNRCKDPDTAIAWERWGHQYCSQCGRPLSPEAWEELRKRLEALNDGKGD